jgi:type IV secretion system protein VirB10
MKRFFDWLRTRSRRREPADADAQAAVDQSTGQIFAPSLRGEHAAPAMPGYTIPGERGISIIAGERSLQTRITSVLLVAVAAILGSGLLAWWYATQLSKSRDARESAQQELQARVGGDSRVPPLGPIDPPTAPQPAASAARADIPPPLLATSTSGTSATAPPAKTEAEIEHEEMLNSPVMWKPESAVRSQAQRAPAPRLPPPGGLSTAALASLLSGGAGATHDPYPADSSLAGELRPTSTPAVSAHVLPPLSMLLPKGTSIDCTLLTAIDSTFDGMVTCMGSSDVYSADGKVVLLERGTMYVGEMKGQARQGQSRVFVLWTEARTPTGVSVQLDSPGTDALGRTGLPGDVDRHFWDRFGAALLITVVDTGLQAAVQGNQSGGNSVVLNPQGAQEVATEALRSTVAIPPTIVKPQGDRIQVMVARDVDFRPVYDLRLADDTSR